MNLYEIDSAIMALVDAETGEISDFEKLDELTMERDKKIENVALMVKNLKADAEAYKAEKEAFAEREKSAKSSAEYWSGWLRNALNGQKFTTTRCAVSFRKSTAVEITDENLLPEEYKRHKESWEPDKKALKAALAEGEVAGAQIVERLGMTIK